MAKDDESNVVLNFRTNGDVEYANTIKQLNIVMNNAAKEYRAQIAAMGENATATDKLVAQQKKLETQLNAAKARTADLRSEFERMSRNTDVSAEALAKQKGKLLDAERAESNLQNQLNKVNSELTDQAKTSRESQERLSDLKTEALNLEMQQKKLTSEFKLQTAELGSNTNEADKLTLAQKQLESQIVLTEKVIANLEKQLVETSSAYGKNSTEALQMETKINEAKTTVAQFRNELEKVGDSSQNAANGLENIGKKIDAGNFLQLAETLQGVSDELIGIGTASIESAMDLQGAQTEMQASLGLTSKDAESLGKVVQSVFKNGVVDSVDSAKEAVILAKQSFSDLNNTDLSKITNTLVNISARTGTDIQDNINATSQLMKNFGITGKEATDLIAKGFQDGLNKNNDFLDTLNEYPTQFKQAGFTAQQMLSIINNGMQSGAFNTDKAADAVKEFQIRLGDGTFESSMSNLSKSTQELFNEWKKGKATTAEVAASVGEDLKKMSPAQQQAELTLLGTQFEDLGVKGSLALLDISNSYDDVNGKADDFNKKTPGEEWQGALRDLQTSLVPLLEQLTPVVSKMADLAQKFNDLPNSTKTTIVAIAGVVAVFATLTPAIASVIGIFAILGTAITTALPIILSIVAIVTAVILIFKNWDKIMQTLSETWDKTCKKGQELWGSFKDWLSQNWDKIKQKTEETWTGLKDWCSGTWDATIKKGQTLWNAFKNYLAEIWSSIKTSASEKWTSIKEKIVSPINEAKDKVGQAIEKIKSFFSNLRLKLPKIEIPALPHFSISGKFSLKPPSVPHINVDWRAKGAVFTEPTIFGMNNGRLQGIGEAGPEAALPLNEETLGAIGKGIAATMGNQTASVVNLQIDGRTFASLIAPYIDKQLNVNLTQKSFGMGGF